jgi:hypothetical protein
MLQIDQEDCNPGTPEQPRMVRTGSEEEEPCAKGLGTGVSLGGLFMAVLVSASQALSDGPGSIRQVKHRLHSTAVGQKDKITLV